MVNKSKETIVYESTGAGLDEILGAAVADEPSPTPRAAQLVEEARAAGPVLPGSASMPTLAGSGGGAGELVDGGAVDDPPRPSPRESAEHVIELLFALVPAGDWQPDSQQERDELIAAVERVFVVRGWTLSLPPEAILVAVAGKYARRRMQRPAVRARMGPWLKKLPLLGKLAGAGAEEPAAPPAAQQASPFDAYPRMTPPAA